jgi:hypothetical protein
MWLHTSSTYMRFVPTQPRHTKMKNVPSGTCLDASGFAADSPTLAGNLLSTMGLDNYRELMRERVHDFWLTSQGGLKVGVISGDDIILAQVLLLNIWLTFFILLL